MGTFFKIKVDTIPTGKSVNIPIINLPFFRYGYIELTLTKLQRDHLKIDYNTYGLLHIPYIKEYIESGAVPMFKLDNEHKFTYTTDYKWNMKDNPCLKFELCLKDNTLHLDKMLPSKILDHEHGLPKYIDSYNISKHKFYYNDGDKLLTSTYDYILKHIRREYIFRAADIKIKEQNKK